MFKKSQKYFYILLTVCLQFNSIASAEVPLNDSLQDPSGFCNYKYKSVTESVKILRNECTPAQLCQIYKKAKLGLIPLGKTTITMLPASISYSKEGYTSRFVSDAVIRLQQNLGDAVTFNKDHDGKYFVFKNYFWGKSDTVPVFKDLHGSLDNKPVYRAEFVNDFGGFIKSAHEYRQINENLWIVMSNSVDKKAKNGHRGSLFILSKN